MKAVTHLEKVIAGETSAVTHLEKVIAQETAAVTYTEKVIAGIAPPITHLQKVIAGEARPVTHLEYVWAGGSPPSVQEYTGAVPVTFVADGTPLLDYIISGNTVQSGTPTPDNPVIPQGTGERTGNLAPPAWAEDFVQRINNSAQAYINNDILRIYASAGYGEYDIKYIFKAEWKENTRYTFNLTYRRDSIYTNASMLQITYTDGTATQFPRTINDGEWHTIYMTSEANKTIKYLNVWYSSMWLEIKIDSFFVYEGTVRKPYEPYGYKIPISSANTTTPVYFGEVQSTRKIRKLVLTGEESFFRDREREGSWRFYSDALMSAKDNTAICSHFENINSDGVNNSDNIGFCIFYRAQFGCRFSKSIAGTVNEFKAWLAQQYAAGTPVCVWYVLAEPTTGIINESLMRIGDYADTLSMEQAGVQIPTANGSTTLDVETTVKPSEVYIKYRGGAVATLSALSAEVSSPEATEEVNPEETEEEENGSEDISLQHEFEAIE